MLDRHSHRFLFIHVPKVAGLSVSAALESAVNGRMKCLVRSAAISVAREWRWWFVCALGEQRGVRYWEGLKRKSHLLFRLLNLYPPHVTALDWKQKLSADLFDKLFKFTFVRNPWDREVSMYHYILKDRKNPQHAMVKAHGSFAQYLRWSVSEPVISQKSFVADKDGRLLVNFVGRFERLADDFQYVCRLLKLDNVKLPRINTSEHEPYQNYYNAETRDLVERHFQDDITTFGYCFDDVTNQRESASPLALAG